MGLAQGVKAHLLASHPECAHPADAHRLHNVLILDAMYFLYRLSPSTGAGLVESFAALARDFAACGRDRTVVFCFDIDEHVPRAKAETQQRRRARPMGALASTGVGWDEMPAPWGAALSDFSLRRTIVRYLMDNLAISLCSLDATVIIIGPGTSRCVGYGGIDVVQAPEVGEADLSTAVIARSFRGKRVVVQGVDTDAIVILALQAMKDPGLSLSFYFDLGPAKDGESRRMLFDVSAFASRTSLSFLLAVVLMGTDYTKKPQRGCSVATSLAQFESTRQDDWVRKEGGALVANRERVGLFFSSLRGNALDVARELSRAIWLLATWSSLAPPDHTRHGWSADGGSADTRSFRAELPPVPRWDLATALAASQTNALSMAMPTETASNRSTEES